MKYLQKISRIVIMSASAFLMTIFFMSCSDSNQPTQIVNSSAKLKSQTKWLISAIDNSKIRKVNYRFFNQEGKILVAVDYANNGNKSAESNYSYIGDQGKEVKNIYDQSESLLKQESYNYFYNTSGQITRQTSVDSFGNVTKIIDYNYDSEGNVTKKAENDLKGGSSKIYDYTYVKNDGQVTEFRTNFKDEFNNYVILRDSINYNSSTNAIDKFNFDALGKVNVIYSYYYDLAGRLKFEIEKDASGNILNKYLYEYAFY